MMYTSHSSRWLLEGMPPPLPGTRAAGLAAILLRALTAAWVTGGARLDAVAEEAARELRPLREAEGSLPKGIEAGACLWRCRSVGGAGEFAMRRSGWGVF